MSLTQSAGKRVCASHAGFCFYFWLDEEQARVFWANREAYWNKTKGNALYCWVVIENFSNVFVAPRLFIVYINNFKFFMHDIWCWRDKMAYWVAVRWTLYWAVWIRAPTSLAVLYVSQTVSKTWNKYMGANLFKVLATLFRFVFKFNFATSFLSD